MSVQTLHTRVLVSHWLYSSTQALRHCSLCPSLPRLFIAPCRLLSATEIMTNTLLCWIGPRREIKHPYNWRDSHRITLLASVAYQCFLFTRSNHFLTSFLPSLSSLEVFPCFPPFGLSSPALHMSLILLSKIKASIKSWYRNITFILQT